MSLVSLLCLPAIHALLQLDLVKTRQQCGVSEGIHRIVMNVVAESGPGGLLAGLVSTAKKAESYSLEA